MATGFVYVTTQTYRVYTQHGAKVLMDTEEGYVHVSAGKDGVMDYETSRERTNPLYEAYDYKG